VQKQAPRQQGRQISDPVTQTVEIAAEPGSQPKPHRGRWVERFHWPQRRPIAVKPFAYLSPLSDTDDITLPAPYPVGSDEIILGRDPMKVTLVLNDPSVEPAHARIQRQEGSYRLLDGNSTAGTWLNYIPITSEGAVLEHGDLIHVGRVGFRFILREPGPSPKPTAIPQERSH
jgi:hypothetical protein